MSVGQCLIPRLIAEIEVKQPLVLFLFIVMISGTQETQTLHADSLDILVLVLLTMPQVAMYGKQLVSSVVGEGCLRTSTDSDVSCW